MEYFQEDLGDSSSEDSSDIPDVFPATLDECPVSSPDSFASLSGAVATDNLVITDTKQNKDPTEVAARYTGKLKHEYCLTQRAVDEVVRMNISVTERVLCVVLKRKFLIY